MRITVAYNLRTDLSEAQAELLLQEDVERICAALAELHHKITPVEVSGQPDQVVERLLNSEPDLIFNIAEGTIGSAREAFYPGLYEQLGLPFTGGNASLLHMNLDKHLTKTVVGARGVSVPLGVLITRSDQPLPSELRYPLFIKPNSEGSSKGITQDSVVETPALAAARIPELLRLYPAGLVVEEFVIGRELSVPFLESFPGQLLEIVEHTFAVGQAGVRYNIYDYDMKQGGVSAATVAVRCPAELEPQDAEQVRAIARQVFSIMSCPDFGRVDVRLREDGTPFFIELNPLPCLHPEASLMTAARASGLDFKSALRLIVRSAARRFGLALRPTRRAAAAGAKAAQDRPTARELGVIVGRLPPGVLNAITDVKGVKVGHFSRVADEVKEPGVPGAGTVRTGVTAVIPGEGDVFNQRLVASGFILNGVGEMVGLTQVMEWGWLETPILLTNSMSVGKVHAGVLNHLIKRHPLLGTETDVALPVVGEADDSFLNDVRFGINSARDAGKAIEAASAGPVEQGSVGAGTGMVTFDFAGGIGTASRVIPAEEGGYTLGALVLSNFGKMRNLTVDGLVVGRDLDAMLPQEGRRVHSEGSVIVVVATDAPLLSSQLGRLAKRAALGLGRAGSHAASSSGEIIIAFSNRNRTARNLAAPGKLFTLRFIPDRYINRLYEAAIEATEEAVLNAIFCSGGMSGREGRQAPALPAQDVLELLGRGRTIHASH